VVEKSSKSLVLLLGSGLDFFRWSRRPLIRPLQSKARRCRRDRDKFISAGSTASGVRRLALAVGRVVVKSRLIVSLLGSF